MLCLLGFACFVMFSFVHDAVYFQVSLLFSFCCLISGFIGFKLIYLDFSVFDCFVFVYYSAWLIVLLFVCLLVMLFWFVI